jgi:hypothetical protein
VSRASGRKKVAGDRPQTRRDWVPRKKPISSGTTLRQASRFWFAEQEQKRVTLARGFTDKPYFWGGMIAEPI